eukprot:scaffold952_cov409-Prasinococcus_capsulatus_cf.AAC.1
MSSTSLLTDPSSSKRQRLRKLRCRSTRTATTAVDLEMHTVLRVTCPCCGLRNSGHNLGT